MNTIVHPLSVHMLTLILIHTQVVHSPQFARITFQFIFERTTNEQI